jgi:hypothetical protein
MTEDHPVTFADQMSGASLDAMLGRAQPCCSLTRTDHGKAPGACTGL